MDASQVFTWVNQYGLPTVFAVILLVYVLWSQASVMKGIGEAVKSLSVTLGQVSGDLAKLSSAHDRQVETMSEVVRTLDRLQARIEDHDR